MSNIRQVSSLDIHHYSEEARGVFGSLPLSKIRAMIPPAVELTDSSGENGIRYHLLGTQPHPNAYSDTDGAPISITGLEFGQNFDVGKYVVEEIIRIVGLKGGPRVVFPSVRFGSRRNIMLSAENRAKVAQGDYTPIVELRMRVLDSFVKDLKRSKLGNIALGGNSQEASIAAQFAKMVAQELGDDAQVSLLSSEDPSLYGGLHSLNSELRRSPKQLARDFKGKGLEELTELVQVLWKADIAQLSEAQGLSVDRKDSALEGLRIGLILDLAGLAISQGGVNKSLREGMANADSFKALLGFVAARGKLTVVRAENSKILDQKGFNDILSIGALLDIDGLSVRGLAVSGGHSYYNNPGAASYVWAHSSGISK